MEVFASIPEHYHVLDRASDWVRVQRHGASTPLWLEGPCFDASGNLWVVDVPWGRLFKITQAGQVSCELEYEGEPNGLAFRSDGMAFIADYQNGIVQFDPATGSVKTVVRRALLQGFKGLNDLIFSSEGDLYFTDQGQTGLHDPTGCVYRLTAAGELQCLLANIPSPNGLVLSADEKVLYVAVTRANAVWRVPLLERDGFVTKVGAFIQLSGGGGPDGMALDSSGGLAVCHLGMGAVWIFDDMGQPALRLDSPLSRMTTNCAYGGPGMRQLYVTAETAILRATVDTPGRPTVVQR